MTADVTALVVAKAPRAGRVKTRLCPPCTPEQAACLAEAALADTLATVATLPVRRRMVVLDGPPGRWLPAGFAVVAQSTGGLDERLAAAFAGVRGPALLVGMDTPQVTRVLLVRAIAALLTPGVDAVIGDACDGGWWCIGLRRPDPRVFLGIAMSTPETGRLQRERLNALGLVTRSLPVLRDVDYFDDAVRVAAEAPGSRFAAAVADLVKIPVAAAVPSG